MKSTSENWSNTNVLELIIYALKALYYFGLVLLNWVAYLVANCSKLFN